MSVVTIETTITPKYLRGKTKDEIIDHVMRLGDENDQLCTDKRVLAKALRAIRMTYGFGSSPHQSPEQQSALESLIDDAIREANTTL